MFRTSCKPDEISVFSCGKAKGVECFVAPAVNARAILRVLRLSSFLLKSIQLPKRPPQEEGHGPVWSSTALDSEQDAVPGNRRAGSNRMEKIPNRKDRLGAEPISQGDHGVPFLDGSKERLDSHLSGVLACGLSQRVGSLTSKGPSLFDSETTDPTRKGS